MTDNIDLYTLAGEGAIWVQPDGPNTKPVYLGCHELGDIGVPMGTVKLLYCKDASEPNKYLAAGTTKSAPELVTTTLETDVLKTKDYMENLPCGCTMWINRIETGRMNIFGNYYRSFMLKNITVSKRTISKLTSRQPDSQDRTTQKFDLSSSELVDLFKLTAVRLTSVSIESFVGIGMCAGAKCADDSGPAAALGDTFYTATKAVAGSPSSKANVYIWTDGGGTSDVIDANPFGAAEDIAVVTCIQISSTVSRIIAVRGTTDPSNPAEIAYSDDNGATWVNVDVGSTNGTYAMGPKSLCVLDPYNMWLVLSGGEIYFSGDSGVSWDQQGIGVTAQNLYAVDFLNEKYGLAVGAANAILRTLDGGTIWQVVTGPSGQAAQIARCVRVHTRARYWVGYGNGKLYYSNDLGATWLERSFPGGGTGVVADMDWADIMVGVIAHNTAAPVGTLLITIDGGYSWEAITTPTNTGLNGVVMVSPTLILATGNITAGTGLVIRAEPQ